MAERIHKRRKDRYTPSDSVLKKSTYLVLGLLLICFIYFVALDTTDGFRAAEIIIGLPVFAGLYALIYMLMK